MHFIDSGRGMTNEEINSIDAYKQFKRSIFEQQGVGLGLYLCKKIVANENGIMFIEQSADKGLHITVKLKTRRNEK
jgi:K+-sensing histidine kinase KdpD